MTWLVSPRFDLAIFAAPAGVALLLAALRPWLAPSGEVSPLFWVLLVLGVDVAHVWSTIYRTYLDPAELRRRPILYAGAPIAAYAVGVLLYAESAAWFWTALAYLAVWHFVRQQWGWVALYRRRAGETGGALVDGAAIYLATLFPLVWWHAHLPRAFDWFVRGDFLAVPALFQPLASLLAPLWALSLGAFAVRELVLRRGAAVGKCVVVFGTALCWGVGILVTNDDFSFTATNVILHGVPYFALVWLYGQRVPPESRPLRALFAAPLVFYGVVLGLAYLEELAWDRMVWLDHAELFPLPELAASRAALVWIVPLLALPQSTHYVLDAFIWRRRENPGLARLFEPAPREALANPG